MPLFQSLQNIHILSPIFQTPSLFSGQRGEAPKNPSHLKKSCAHGPAGDGECPGSTYGPRAGAAVVVWPAAAAVQLGDPARLVWPASRPSIWPCPHPPTWPGWPGRIGGGVSPVIGRLSLACVPLWPGWGLGLLHLVQSCFTHRRSLFHHRPPIRVWLLAQLICPRGWGWFPGWRCAVPVAVAAVLSAVRCWRSLARVLPCPAFAVGCSPRESPPGQMGSPLPAPGQVYMPAGAGKNFFIF